MCKFEKELEKSFNPKAYSISNTGSVRRDWADLLRSENAKKQVEEVKKLSQSNDKECQ